MLQEKYTVQDLRKVFVPRETWDYVPTAAAREAWAELSRSTLNQCRKAYLVARAEALVGQPWPFLPATAYMDFGRNGNRTRYENPYHERRERLSILALAECWEHKGRFIDEIVNGIWTICEETTWVVPAHSAKGPKGVLARLEMPLVDLFSTQTALVLGHVDYLLGPELDAVSPIVRQRLRQQVEEQVLTEIETRNDFWWWDGHNNWTPWCSGNCLGAAMCLWDDPDRLAALTHRLMEPVDRFLAQYGVDGGCDEGPNYWGRAGGALLDFLELLYTRSNGAVSVYDEPKIANMGIYLARAHMDGPWFTNFADAPAKSHVRLAQVYRYGERVGSEELSNLALLAMRSWYPDGEIDHPLPDLGGDSIVDVMRLLCWVPADARARALPRPTSSWFESIQVAILRQSERNSEGLVLAAKGGNNGESHNHNDIGHFMLMCDGEPAIIDVGVETYTAQTFSPRRYELWCIRSSGHNVPLIDGIEQGLNAEQLRDPARLGTGMHFDDIVLAPASSYCATDYSFEDNGTTAIFTENIATAYPAEIELESLIRTFRFDRAKGQVTVTDALNRKVPTASYILPFYTLYHVNRPAPGRLVIELPDRKLAWDYDPALFITETVSVDIEDPNLQRSWGSRIFKTTFKAVLPAGHIEYTLSFSRI